MNITQQLAHQLGKSIIQGKRQPLESRMTEQTLSEEFGVSRTSVREAVKMLTAKGLVTSHPREGIRVTCYTQWDLYDNSVLGWLSDSPLSASLLAELLQLRIAVEPRAVFLATKTQPNNFQQFNDSLRIIQYENTETFTSQIFAIHSKFLQLSQNRFFKRFRYLLGMVNNSPLMTDYYRSQAPHLVTKYEKLLTAFSDADAYRTQIEMEHILNCELSYLQTLEPTTK
ncbi:GntR family transcriptional regulator (plasmid) [Alteromonas sp. I4]|nr:GntR family transcriptional regulator [Alteromonas sp. I4]